MSDSVPETSDQLSWYERHIVPSLIDLLCGMPAISKQRSLVVPQASGEVLEPGLGTGRNLAFYQADQVSRICGIDPAAEASAKTRKRIAETGLNVELMALSAERIPADDQSFDSVVLTYTLCSIPDPVAALREMHRVLKPEGKLLYCEHGAAPEPGVRRWQDRLTPHWRKIAGNCHMNREIPALLEEGGFRVVAPQAGYIKGPRVLTFNYWGVAVKG